MIIITVMVLALMQDGQPQTSEDDFSGPEAGFILPSLGAKLKKDVEELERNVGLINADLTGIKSHIEKIETKVDTVQVGLKNTTVGWSIMSGDVGFLSVLAFTGLGMIFLAYWQRRQIIQLREELKGEADIA